MKRILILALLAVLVSLPALAADQVKYGGSTTLAEAMFAAGKVDQVFEAKTGIKVLELTKDFNGTGKGIEAVASGALDIGGAGRSLKPDEKIKGLVGTIVAYDAIAVFIHKDNPVKDLSKAQIKAILTGKERNWKAFGGQDVPIKVFTEPVASKRATVEMVNELAMDKAPWGTGFVENEDHVAGLGDVSRDPGGLKLASLGFLNVLSADVKSRLKVISMDSIEPSDESINSGAYLLSRPMVLVTKGVPSGNAKKFMDFILSAEGQAILGKSYLPVRKGR